MAFKFERLKVWQKALMLSDMINQVVKCFPADERYVLTSQIKRAADSVSLNIAEGSTGQTNREQKKFIGYSIRSDVEVVGCLYLARSRGYIQQEDFEKIYKLCEELLVMLNGFRDSLKD